MKKRWRILIILYIVRVAMGIQYQSIASVSHILIGDLGINYTQLGTLIGLYQLPGVILAFPGGLLARRFEDKRLAVMALALMTLGGSLIGVSGAYNLAVLGRLLSGFGYILLNTTLTKMVYDWFAGYEIILAMAIFVSSWPLGISIALVTLIRIALATSWQLVMHLTSAISFISLVIITALYHEPKYTDRKEKSKPAQLRVSRSEALLVSLAGLIWSLFNVGFIILPSFAPEFLISKGYSATLASSLVSTVTWIVIPSVIVGGYIAERIGQPNIIMIACFSSIGTALILLTQYQNPLPLFIALGVLFGPPAGVIMALPNEVLRAENRGPGMGIFYTVYYAGMATLPALAGFIQDTTENHSLPFLFGGSLFFLMIIILSLFRYSQRVLDSPRSNQS